jgi:hypothetical protein
MEARVNLPKMPGLLLIIVSVLALEALSPSLLSPLEKCAQNSCPNIHGKFEYFPMVSSSPDHNFPTVIPNIFDLHEFLQYARSSVKVKQVQRCGVRGKYSENTKFNVDHSLFKVEWGMEIEN